MIKNIFDYAFKNQVLIELHKSTNTKGEPWRVVEFITPRATGVGYTWELAFDDAVKKVNEKIRAG